MSGTEDEPITIIVRINGTDENPHHRYGLKQNPFPQIGHMEYNTAEKAINSLDGDPITSVDDIRKRLPGFSEDFIELCIANYRPGERTAFAVTFPRSRMPVRDPGAGPFEHGYGNP